MKQKEIIRQIEVTDKASGEIDREIDLFSFDLEKMKKIFDVAEEDPEMYDQYEITPELASHFTGIHFEFSKFEYNLVCLRSLF